MAYRSKISRNRYYGSTFAGRVATSRETPLSDIVDAINRNTGDFERFAENYVDGKKDAANKYLEGYYATGGTPDKLASEILTGSHPELENMYAETAIDTHNGRFMANKAIAEIERMSDTYTPFEDGKEQTWNEWVGSLKYEDGSSVMPSLEGKSKGFNTGFATQFGEFRANALVADATMRGKHWQNKKMEAGMNYMHTELMHMDKVGTDYWQHLQTLNTELPQVSGLTGKQYYYTTKELNDLAMNHASWVLSNATTVEELDRAMSILTADRGTGKNGQALGSLMNTKSEAVATLIQNINNKKVTFKNQSRADVEYNDNQDIKNMWVDFLAKENPTLQEREDFKSQLKKYGNPNLMSSVDTFYDKNRFTNNDPAQIDEWFKQVLNGNLESPAEVLQWAIDNNIPRDKLGTALSYWTYQQQDKNKGANPIYYTDSVYTNQMTNVLSAVKGSFTNRQTGLAKDGQEEAVMNAENYIIKSIVDFEMNYKKDNGGKMPSPQERFEFMEKLGQTISTMFTGQTTAFPDSLSTPFTEIEENIVKAEEAAQVKTTAINTALPDVIQDIQLDTTVEALTKSIQENLPNINDLKVNNDLIPLNNINQTEYTNNFVVPYTVELLRGMIPDNIAGYSMNQELYSQMLKGMEQDTLDSIVNNLAKSTGLPAQQVVGIVRDLFTTYQNVTYTPPSTGITTNQSMDTTKVVKAMPSGGHAKKSWIQKYGETHNADGTPKIK